MSLYQICLGWGERIRLFIKFVWVGEREFVSLSILLAWEKRERERENFLLDQILLSLRERESLYNKI